MENKSSACLWLVLGLLFLSILPIQSFWQANTTIDIYRACTHAGVFFERCMRIPSVLSSFFVLHSRGLHVPSFKFLRQDTGWQTPRWEGFDYSNSISKVQGLLSLPFQVNGNSPSISDKPLSSSSLSPSILPLPSHFPFPTHYLSLSPSTLSMTPSPVLEPASTLLLPISPEASSMKPPVVAAIVTSVASLVFLVLGVFIWKRWRRSKKRTREISFSAPYGTKPLLQTGIRSDLWKDEPNVMVWTDSFKMNDAPSGFRVFPTSATKGSTAINLCPAVPEWQQSLQQSKLSTATDLAVLSSRGQNVVSLYAPPSPASGMESKVELNFGPTLIWHESGMSPLRREQYLTSHDVSSWMPSEYVMQSAPIGSEEEDLYPVKVPIEETDLYPPKPVAETMELYDMNLFSVPEKKQGSLSYSSNAASILALKEVSSCRMGGFPLPQLTTTLKESVPKTSTNSFSMGRGQPLPLPPALVSTATTKAQEKEAKSIACLEMSESVAISQSRKDPERHLNLVPSTSYSDSALAANLGSRDVLLSQLLPTSILFHDLPVLDDTSALPTRVSSQSKGFPAKDSSNKLLVQIKDPSKCTNATLSAVIPMGTKSSQLSAMLSPSLQKLKSPTATNPISAPLPPTEDFVESSFPRFSSMPSSLKTVSGDSSSSPLPSMSAPVVVAKGLPPPLPASKAPPPPPPPPPPPTLRVPPSPPLAPMAPPPPPPAVKGPPPPPPPPPPTSKSHAPPSSNPSATQPPFSLQGRSSDESEEFPKLKPLHWEKVSADPSRSTVWEKLKTGSFHLDESGIATLFGWATANVKKEVGKVSVVSPAKRGPIDSKKAQNIAIQLKALNISTEEICNALLEGDGLKAELLDVLAKMSPTLEEQKALMICREDKALELGPAERFLISILEVSFAFQRVEAMRFKASYSEDILYVTESLQTLESACGQIKDSRLFLKLLEAVLKTGNLMNRGTARGEAEAFKLDALLKLVEVKSADGKTTLLHFVVEEIAKSEGLRAVRTSKEADAMLEVESLQKDLKRKGLEVVVALFSELNNVKKAAEIDADALCQVVSRITMKISAIQAKLKANFQVQESSTKELPKKDSFYTNMDLFCSRAADDLVKIQQDVNRVLEQVKCATEYFHGNQRETQPFRLLVIVRDFLLVLEKVCKDIAKPLKITFRG